MRRHLLAVHPLVLQQRKVEMGIMVVLVETVAVPRVFRGDLQDILVMRRRKRLPLQKLTLVVVVDIEMADEVTVDNI